MKLQQPLLDRRCSLTTPINKATSPGAHQTTHRYSVLQEDTVTFLTWRKPVAMSILREGWGRRLTSPGMDKGMTTSRTKGEGSSEDWFADLV